MNSTLLEGLKLEVERFLEEHPELGQLSAEEMNRVVNGGLHHWLECTLDEAIADSINSL